MKATEIVELLRARHSKPSNEWAFFAELRCGTGYDLQDGHSVEQRIDAFALNCWPSKKYERVAYEIKVTRQDFIHEIDHPEKREQALMLSNRFYFVAPEGVIGIPDVPEEAGLMQVNALGITRILKQAPLRDAGPMPMSFIASILRREATR